VHIGTRGLIESTRLLDVGPWLTWRVPPPHLVALAAYYLAVAAWWRGVRRAELVAAALFVWIIAAPTARVRAHGDGALHVTMFDVGQGDAMLITFPNGRTMVLDAGGVSVRGDFDVGERVLGPALRHAQLLSLDYLAVTHADPDHAGGAAALVRNFSPPEVWWGPSVANHALSARVMDEARTARASWRTLQRGDRLEIGGVELRVHHPSPPEWERQKVRNDDSLVIELRYGRVSIVLTGDIGREVEAELVSTLDLLPLRVLKVPHHGSGTSSSPALLDHVRPAVALIGVGRGNMYGHPVPHVLERYRQLGTDVFRTDRDGQINLTTDGRRVLVRTFTGRQHESTKGHESTKARETTK
jgi:competence protein ComEC